MFAVGLTTCRLRNQYVQQTVESIAVAGFSLDVVQQDDFRCRLGCKPTFKRCLRALLDSPRTEPCLIVFQDDVRVARGLKDWLVEHIPRSGIVSLYTASPHDGQDGWRPLDLTPTETDPQPWRRSLGACAIAMDWPTASLYLDRDPQFERTDRLGASLGEFCHRQGLAFWVHSPSLVQHVGEVRCRPGMPMTEDRRAKRFCEDVRELRAEG